MKVLIVEEHPPLRRLIKTIISEFATEVIECQDGREVLAVYQRHNPDWILMDLNLNGINGLTMVRQLKSLPGQARIVIVTDYDDDSLREAARQAGACAYVIKEELFALNRILHQIF